MKISRSILLLLIICTGGGLTLAAGLYAAHDHLSQLRNHRNALELSQQRADRLGESLRQWLLWSDLIMGSGNTYLTDGALDHAHVLRRIVSALQDGPAEGLCSPELKKIRGFVDRHTQRLQTIAQGANPATLYPMLDALDRESSIVIAGQQAVLQALNHATSEHAYVLEQAQINTRRLTAGMALSYVLIVLIAYRYTALHLIEPVRALTRVAAAPHPTAELFLNSKSGPDEICRLADKLAAFAQEIQNRISDLRDSNQSLNTEVQERQRVERSLRDSEAALRLNEERFRTIFAQSNDGIFVVDMDGDRYLDVNPQACAMMGYPRDELLTLGPSHFHGHEAERLSAFKESIYRHKRGRSDELSCATASGELLPVEVSASTFVTPDGQTCLIAMVRDISERKRVETERETMHQRLREHAAELEQQRQQLVREMSERHKIQRQLEHDAGHDALTGLPNRRWFKQQLARRSDGPANVIFIDLDDFKLVNDSLGHDAGDLLLIETAKRMRLCLNQMGRGVAARLGGDEFVILIEGPESSDDTEKIACLLQDRLAESMVISGQEVSVGISIGIAGNGDTSHGSDDLLRDADTAMYRAKLSGKARHAVFDQSMHQENAARLALETDLRHAVENERLTLAFQPLVHLEGADVASFEALVRWDRPGHGPVSPAVFVALAEELNLIIPLGAFVLTQACQELSRLNALRSPDRPLTMAVNVSRKQLIKPGFVDDVKRTLAHNQTPAQLLTVEVTESMVMSDLEATRSTLLGLRGLGVRIAMDDFGTGHSSLGCLHEIPLDVLKIDQAFVANLDGHVEHTAILNAIITLADQLNLDVVAEGIETLDQMAQILTLGCGYGQGYLFSKPLTAPAARAIVNTPFRARKSA